MQNDDYFDHVHDSEMSGKPSVAPRSLMEVSRPSASIQGSLKTKSRRRATKIERSQSSEYNKESAGAKKAALRHLSKSETEGPFTG
jgi:hypothetical protein